MRRVLDWAATLLFLPFFGLVMLAFEPIQRVARLFGQRAHDWSASCLYSSVVASFRLTGLRLTIETARRPTSASANSSFRLTGLRLTIERAPTVAPYTSYILVSNHQSMFDIVLLGHVFFFNFVKFVSKRSLARGIPSVSYNLTAGGHALIDRGDAEQAVPAIETLGRRLERDRVSAIIFPEGTRARRGALQPFKGRGALALLAAAPTTPVVPIAIDGSWRLMEHGFFPVPFGQHLRVAVGAPIARTPGDDPSALLAQVEHEIAEMLRRTRGEPPLAAADPIRAAH